MRRPTLIIVCFALLVFAPIALTVGFCGWYPGGTPNVCGHNTPLLWVMLEGLAVVAFVAWRAAQRKESRSNLSNVLAIVVSRCEVNFASMPLRLTIRSSGPLRMGCGKLMFTAAAAA